MASNLIQTDMDAVYTAALNSSVGPYNPVGTDVGEIIAARASSDWETNIVALIALVEFLIANTADPSNSDADRTLCRHQRKAVKELLVKASKGISMSSSNAADDRATRSGAMLANLINAYNTQVRPAGF